MKKIKYLYIPIGGTGKRLHADEPSLEYSSKCFLSFNQKTLLQRILENCTEFVEEIVITYCLEQQGEHAKEFFSHHPVSRPVHLVHDPFIGPYVCIPPSGDCLAVMGDSFVPKQTWNAMFHHVFSDPCLTFLRFDPPMPNQDFAYYRLDGDYITDWSHHKSQGYTHFEIGQLIYFPEITTKDVAKLCAKTDALTVLRSFIKSLPRTKCLDLPCYNINTGKDYQCVKQLILDSDTEEQ